MVYNFDLICWKELLRSNCHLIKMWIHIENKIFLFNHFIKKNHRSKIQSKGSWDFIENIKRGLVLKFWRLHLVSCWPFLLSWSQPDISYWRKTSFKLPIIFNFPFKTQILITLCTPLSCQTMRDQPCLIYSVWKCKLTPGVIADHKTPFNQIVILPFWSRNPSNPWRAQRRVALDPWFVALFHSI